MTHSSDEAIFFVLFFVAVGSDFFCNLIIRVGSEMSQEGSSVVVYRSQTMKAIGKADVLHVQPTEEILGGGGYSAVE